MIDRESLRQRLLISEDEAAQLQEQEAQANRFESQQGLKFAAFMFGVPILTSWMITASIINPLLDKAFERAEAFPLSTMQEIEGAHEVHREEVRLRMEMAIGLAPSLSDDEMQDVQRFGTQRG